MTRYDEIELRRILFLEGLREGLNARALHEFIELGMEMGERGGHHPKAPRKRSA